MARTVTDDDLRSAQSGDPVALRALYRELAPGVLGYLRAHGVVDAEDLTSEVFLTVFTRLATVRGGATGLRTFLFSVAHARMVDDVRRRSRQPQMVPYDPHVDRRTGASAETEAAARADTDRVLGVLSRLGPEQRDVLVLRLVTDATLEETASALGKSTGAVKQLQRRGLIALRVLLSESGVTL